MSLILHAIGVFVILALPTKDSRSQSSVTISKVLPAATWEAIDRILMTYAKDKKIEKDGRSEKAMST